MADAMAEVKEEINETIYTPRATVEELRSIITESSNGLLLLPSDSYNEVFDGIFLGESSIALNFKELQTLGITHLLNAAQGTKFYHVNTGPEDYIESGIIFHGIPAMDSFLFKLDRYFDEASEFIAKAVGTKNTGQLDGKILVHCKEGVSRSASLVLAYLVRDQEMQLTDAVRLVRSKREIIPNDGFLGRVSRKLRPRKLRPQTSDPENSDPENSDLEKSDPEKSDPENSDPENSDLEKLRPRKLRPVQI